MNPTQPSDTPRSDQSEIDSRVPVTLSRQLERELNQWRACAEKLNECARHHPTCYCRVADEDVTGDQCDCGLNEAREMFEKLKGEK